MFKSGMFENLGPMNFGKLARNKWDIAKEDYGL